MSVERTLHHFPLDPASRQVRLALGEKRLAFAEAPVRYWEAPPEFAALNPSGLPPVLVETRNQRTVTACETRAILEHIEETEPEPPLLGRDPAERAEARRLLQWFDRKFDNEVNGFLLHEKMEKRLLRLGAPDEPGRLRRRRPPVGHRLFRRRAVEGLPDGQDLVHEAEVETGLPSHPGRPLARPRAGRAL